MSSSHTIHRGRLLALIFWCDSTKLMQSSFLGEPTRLPPAGATAGNAKNAPPGARPQGGWKPGKRHPLSIPHHTTHKHESGFHAIKESPTTRNDETPPLSPERNGGPRPSHLRTTLIGDFRPLWNTSWEVTTKQIKRKPPLRNWERDGVRLDQREKKRIPTSLTTHTHWFSRWHTTLRRLGI